MSLITDIFAGPYATLAKWGVIATLAVSLFGFGWVRGNEHGTEKLTAYIGKQAVETVRVARARDIVTTNVVLKYVKVKGDTEVVTKLIEKEVVRYAEQNSGYCLDSEWRRLHDSAASGAVPNTTTGTDAAPRAAEALEGVTSNYGAAKRNEDKLRALQDWVREQQKVK